VDEDEASEQGMRMSRSLLRSFKNRPELADLRAKLEAPVSPAGLAVSGVPEISVGPRVLVHGDQGQGKTVLAEAAFLELQGLRANYDADFHRFRASSEQGDSCAAHLLDTFRQSVFFMQLSLECQCKLFVLQFYVQSCVCFINAWLCGINASWASSVYVMCVKCFTLVFTPHRHTSHSAHSIFKSMIFKKKRIFCYYFIIYIFIGDIFVTLIGASITIL